VTSNLKVAVFNTQPPHLYFGGVERRIVENAKLLRNKIETTVYSGTKKGFSKPDVMNGIKFIPCFSTDILFPLDNWVFNNSLSRKVESIKADVFEAHNVSGYKFLKKLKERKIRKPFIQTVHGVLADEYIQSSKTISPTLRMKFSNFYMRRFGEIEKEASKRATLVVTVSSYSAKRIVQLYDVDDAKIRIVPNGVDVKAFKPTLDCESLKNKIRGDGKQLVLFVGNLIPRKGLHYLIEAAKYIVKEHKQTKFVIVGEGPLKKSLISYTKAQGVFENFSFLGDVPEEMLHSLYNCADVFASPSIQEGQGISLLEAQATAKPVVAFNVSAISEVVKNGETGLLVNSDSYELAQAILCLLSDRSLRIKMGIRGRKFVFEKFSWDVCAQKMFKVYCEAVSSQFSSSSID
jgi:glycosyltransferase involved in cell wall biosynthesis